MAALVLTLDPRGNDFILCRIAEDGSKSEMILSEGDIMKLTQSALRLKQEILSKRSRPEAGIGAVVATPVIQFRSTLDVHKSELLLTMIDPKKMEMTFVLGLEILRALTVHLKKRLADIERANPTRQ